MSVIDERLFRDVVSRFATGVTVVTTRDDRGNLFGLTANAFASVSLQPPLILVCLNNSSGTYKFLKQAGSFAVHILAEDQQYLARAFAQRGRDKGLLVDWQVGEGGIPGLRHCLASMDCKVAHEYAGGDHVIVVGRVERVRASPETDKPLLYYRGALSGLQLIKLRAGAREISWGGATQDAQRAAWTESFTHKTGVTVVQEGPTDYARFKSLTANGGVSWDLLDVEGDFAYRAASDDLLEPLDFSVIDKQDIDPRFVFEYGIGSFYFSFVLAYNQTVIGEHVPTGWNDLFDIERFPGKRALYKVSSPGVLELALLADGVPPENLYPLDLDSAFKKLDSIRDKIVFWSYGAESQQLLVSGTASLGMFWNGRVYDLAKSDTAIRSVWNQNLAIADYLIIPKGCPNKHAVMQFIAHAVSRQSQAELANVAAYAPINMAAINDVRPEVVPYLPTTHQETQVILDVSYWAQHAAEITERWNAWLPVQKTD